MKNSQIFLVAGEPSGDHHAAHLVRELKKLSGSSFSFEGLGGPEMAEEGVKIHFELARYPIMGAWGIASNLGVIWKTFHHTLTHLRRTRPKLLILVDYPGFNLQLAREAKKLGIPVVYYISPQIWAWWPGRIKRIPKRVDKMLVILPFEKDLYDQVHLPAEYVGHPTFDFLSSQDFSQQIPLSIEKIQQEKKWLLGILPGSRTKEIEFNLPIMLQAAQNLSKKIPHLSFLIGVPNEDKKKLVESILPRFPLRPEILVGKTHFIMAHSRFCLIKSGTATLELSYFQVPMVIHYRVDNLSYFVGKRILSTPYFGLPNILSGREIVPERLMRTDEVEMITDLSLPLVEDTEVRKKCLLDLAQLHELLSQKKGASKNAARAVFEMVQDLYPEEKFSPGNP